jgi:hypothetical protein
VTCTDPKYESLNSVLATGRAQRMEAEKFQNIWTGILWRMLAAAVLSAEPPDGACGALYLSGFGHRGEGVI